MSKGIGSRDNYSQTRVLLPSFYTEIWVQTRKVYKIREASKFCFYCFFVFLKPWHSQHMSGTIIIILFMCWKINKQLLTSGKKESSLFPWQMLQRTSAISLKSGSTPQQGISTNVGTRNRQCCFWELAELKARLGGAANAVLSAAPTRSSLLSL